MASRTSVAYECLAMARAYENCPPKLGVGEESFAAIDLRRVSSRLLGTSQKITDRQWRQLAENLGRLYAAQSPEGRHTFYSSFTTFQKDQGFSEASVAHVLGVEIVNGRTS